MPENLFRLYQRKRVININANIIIAGIGSTVIVVCLIWMLKIVFGTNWPSWGYTAFAAVVDIILDVTIFICLHMIANHWRPLKGRDEKEQLKLGAVAPPHIEDTARVQFERVILSPFYYIIAVGGTEFLQRQGMHPAWAVSMAYPVSLLISRTIHTIWGFKSGTYHDHDIQEKRRRLAALHDERRRRHEARQRSRPDLHRMR